VDTIKKARIKHFFSSSKGSKLAALVAALVVLGVGYVVLQTGAASFFASVKLSDGSVTGNARVIDDGGASGGRAVEFGPAAGEPDPQPDPGPDPGPPPGGGDGGGGATGECPPFPAFPDQNCTGVPAGVSLSPDGCPFRITEANKVYDGCIFTSGFRIISGAHNVTIRNSKINLAALPPSSGANRGSMQNLTLINVEFDGLGNWNNNNPQISGSDFTCIRCYVHSGPRGMNIKDNVRIIDSYIPGNFVYQSGDHKTAIGLNGGSNVEIIHNNLTCSSDKNAGCSAALSLYGDFAPVDDILVQNNLFNVGPGTGSYCTYGGSVSSKPYPIATNVRYIDNRFGRKFHPNCGIFGPVASWASGHGNVWSGNAWADGSGPVNP
jgi:hypothetical protein